MDEPKISQSLFGPRVRIAPSPTGWLHLGTARTALFNFLFARHHGGKFILRIEDTDQVRSQKKYEKNIIEGFQWLGINPDEGPEIGGEFGPYRQSERKEIYEKYTKKLLKEGKAYYCFCSPEELEIQRQEMLSRGVAPKYSGKCTFLTKNEIKKNLLTRKPAVIRFQMPEGKVKVKDLIRGDLEFDLHLIGDIVIAKSLSEPLYNYAVVIDDYLMKISHVIRGEDHISNTPKQIVIQEALGFSRPDYAHLPMILGSDRSKLSKRHGALALSEYQKMGYLPEAMVNFIALLGWHPSGDKELFTLEELITQFSLERVQKSGAVFSIQKLNWFNAQYLRKAPLDVVLSRVADFLKEKKIIVGDKKEGYSLNYLKKVLEVELPRINKLEDLLINSDFFFVKELNYPANLLFWKNMNKEKVISSLNISLEILKGIKESDFNQINLQIKYTEKAEKIAEYNQNRGSFLWPLRVALSGKEASPGPFEIAEILGKTETIRRLRIALQIIKNYQ